MKTLLTIIALSVSTMCYGQLSAKIHLKNGRIIEVYHFGQMGQGKTVEPDFKTYAILMKGAFYGQEMTFYKTADYHKISKIALTDYDQDEEQCPREKGTIVITKTDGKVFSLENTVINNGKTHSLNKCNNIVVAVINPLTEQTMETAIALNEISYISFGTDTPPPAEEPANDTSVTE